MKRMFPILLLTILVFSCGDDDNGFGGEIVPPRSFVEVAAEDDAAIREFLQTHFYNYEEFDNPPADFDFKVRIDTIAGENATKTPLIDQVESAVVNVSDFEFSLSQDEEDIPHTLYYLQTRVGQRDGTDGPRPSIADSALVRYEGRTLDSLSTFDGSVTPVWLDLAQIHAPQQPRSFRGFGEGLTFFNAGGNVTDNPDGTISVEEFGTGLIIFPSALANFNVNIGAVGAYTPLLFIVDLITTNETDHDNDGIPSIQEDLDGDGYLYNDNTDSEEETNANFPPLANFLDADDDGDGISTREEISDADGNIIFPYPDDNNNGIDDYLEGGFERTVDEN